MNKITHEDTTTEMRIHKIPLSHIQNVRHCTSKNKFGFKADKTNFLGEFQH